MVFEEFEAKIKEWTKEEGMSYSFYYKEQAHAVSKIDPDQSPWWSVFSKCLSDLNLEVETEIFPAGTDSRFLRKLGIPAFGFSPINNTKGMCNCCVLLSLFSCFNSLAS